MFNFLKKLFSIKPKDDFEYRGARLDDQKVLDGFIKQEEIVAKADPVKWVEIDLTKVPKYSVRNQNGSSSCVAFSMALISSIMYFLYTRNWIDFSASWFYSKRNNKPEEGMTASNSDNIWQTTGALPEAFMPSDNKSEAEMNNPKSQSFFPEIAKEFIPATKQIILPAGNIDEVASVIQKTGKPVNVWYQFASGEWNKVVKLTTNKVAYAHSAVALLAGLYKGQKALVLQDSWGRDLSTNEGLRIVTEEFHNKRNYFARYWRRFKFEPDTSVQPTYDGTTVSLQDCLKFDGVFPTSTDSTGYFGQLTIQAVKDFQKKYGINQTGNVGPITTKRLKELYP